MVWKEKIYPSVVRCLGHRDPRTLVAAVKCLGALPVDKAAAPALAYIDNPNPEVRQQTLLSFAPRTLLLTDDMLLTRLHDQDPMIQTVATTVLKGRGLNQEQISLGGLIFSPKPQQRISVIPLLKDRTDVDPAIWLIQLSRDPEEMVRARRHRGDGRPEVAVGPAEADGDGALGPLGDRPQGRRQARTAGAGANRVAASPARLGQPESKGQLSVPWPRDARRS